MYVSLFSVRKKVLKILRVVAGILMFVLTFAMNTLFLYLVFKHMRWLYTVVALLSIFSFSAGYVKILKWTFK